jgi:hypothetical protein
MKLSYLALTLIGLGGCTNGITTSQSQATNAQGLENLVFSRDLRPVDGALTEITINKNSQGKYDATLTNTYAGGSGANQETETIATGMDCTFDQKEPGILERADAGPKDYLLGLTCIVDKRPSDGEKKELTLVKDTTGNTFKATLASSFFDRRSGNEASESKELASRLKLAGTLSAPITEIEGEKTLFIRDLRATDGLLTEIAIIKTENGIYSATFTVTSAGRGGNHQDQKLLGEGMACNFSKDGTGAISQVLCEVDDRPIDGTLQELTIKRQDNGRYSASHRTAWVDFQTGEPGEVIEALAKDLQLR